MSFSSTPKLHDGCGGVAVELRHVVPRCPSTFSLPLTMHGHLHRRVIKQILAKLQALHLAILQATKKIKLWDSSDPILYTYGILFVATSQNSIYTVAY